MKAIEKYVFKSFLSSFALAFVVLSFVLTIGLFVQIIGYIIDGMPAALIGRFAMVSFPETLQWTIPLALLVSGTLVFSRLSADGEIAAMRACGINLITVIRPPVVFALCCTLLSVWINNEIAPRGHEIRRNLTSRLSVGNALDLIEPGIWIEDFPKMKLYVARKDGNVLEGVTVEDHSNKRIVYTYRAARATVTGEGSDVRFELEDATRMPVDEKNPQMVQARRYVHQFKLKEIRYNRKVKDMRFVELVQKIAADSKAVGEIADDKLRREMKRELSKNKVELAKRFAFALASVAFVLVGIPLGIRAQRRETTVGMAIAIGIALGYYAVIMLMLSLQKDYQIAPHWLIFAPFLSCLLVARRLIRQKL